MKATIRFDTDHHAGEIDRRLFSGFLEHLGRAVYEGVYDPGNPQSDADGFRTDVLEALRRLRMPYVRYPGGNFVSNYDWRDGIGPREQRPARPDFAWKSIVFSIMALSIAPMRPKASAVAIKEPGRKILPVSSRILASAS